MKNKYILLLAIFGILQSYAMNNNLNVANNQMTLFGLEIDQRVVALNQNAKDKIEELNKRDEEYWKKVKSDQENNFENLTDRHKHERCQTIKNIFQSSQSNTIPAKLLNQFFKEGDYEGYSTILSAVYKRKMDKAISEEHMNFLIDFFKYSFVSLIPIVAQLDVNIEYIRRIGALYEVVALRTKDLVDSDDSDDSKKPLSQASIAFFKDIN